MVGYNFGLNIILKNYIDTFSTETEKRAQFRKDFPSLYNTLQELENMVE